MNPRPPATPPPAEDLESWLSSSEWLLDIPAGGPRESAFADALLHVGNGYQGLRVTADLDDPHADPGFFATDVYDTGIGVGREIVNLPNPLGLRIRHGHATLGPAGTPHRILDLRNGWAYIDRPLAGADGLGARLTTLTAVHAGRPALGVQVGMVELPVGTGPVALETYWDDSTGNPYMGGSVPGLRMYHTEVRETEAIGGELRLDCRLAGTGARLRLRSRVRAGGETHRLPVREPRRVGETVVVDPGPTGRVPFELVWSVGTGDALPGDDDMPDAWTLLKEHRAAWHDRWETYGITVDGDEPAQRAVRYNLFQLVQHELPVRPQKLTPARGLSSSYHSGATFFDTELHKDAFWAWNMPGVARSHLEFRHATLDAAREFARNTGFAGARFPEATNDLGRENGPHDVLAYPDDGQIKEWSVREVLHISADVAYAVRRYHRVTGDDAFLAEKGAELVLEAARFAASVFQWCPDRQAYVVRSVMGPDEYHYHVDNNHFTNSMLRWNLTYALELAAGTGELDAETAAALLRRLGVDDDELRGWSEIADAVFLPPPLAGGVPAQHEGYEQLPDCRPREHAQGPAARLSPDEADLATALENFPTKLVKQADVVLLMHLHPDAVAPEAAAETFAYYERRTAHESSLSAAPHGVVAARLGLPDDAYAFFLRAARYNLDFHPRTDYRNGLHLSAYAGAWQVLVEGFLAAEPLGPNALRLRPLLPGHWSGLTVPLRYRGRTLRVEAAHSSVTVRCLSGPDLRVELGDRTWTLVEGHAVTAAQAAPVTA